MTGLSGSELFAEAQALGRARRAGNRQRLEASPVRTYLAAASPAHVEARQQQCQPFLAERDVSVILHASTDIQAEAFALARAHRQLRPAAEQGGELRERREREYASCRGGRPPRAVSLDARSAGAAKMLEPSTTQESWRASACPVCGTNLDSSIFGHSDSTQEAGMEDRLAILEELLAKARPQAREAAELRQKLAAAMARSADLEAGMASAHSLCQELSASPQLQTTDFKRFADEVRRAAGPWLAARSVLEAELDAITSVSGALASSVKQQRSAVRKFSATQATQPKEDKEELEQKPVQQVAPKSPHRELKAELSQALRAEITEEQEMLVAAEQRKSRQATAEEHRAIIEALEARLEEEGTNAAQARRHSQDLSESLAEMRSASELAATEELERGRQEFSQCRNEMGEYQEKLRRTTLRLEDRDSELAEAVRNLESYAEESATAREEVRRSRTAVAVAERAAEEARQQLQEKALRAQQRIQRSSAAREPCVTSVKAIDSLRQGAVVSKLCARNGSWQQRFVGLSPVPPASPLDLKWSDDVRGRTLGRRATSVCLKEVVHVGFGSEPLPHGIRHKEKPWCCFSVWTAKRSFHFKAESEEVAEAFVLGLSRLCPNTQPASLSSVRLHRALSKLGPDRKSRVANMLQALRKASSNRGGQAAVPAAALTQAAAAMAVSSGSVQHRKGKDESIRGSQGSVRGSQTSRQGADYGSSIHQGRPSTASVAAALSIRGSQMSRQGVDSASSSGQGWPSTVPSSAAAEAVGPRDDEEQEEGMRRRVSSSFSKE
eukprot:TRINITY_DN105855_c0_g1_i1.p1 TRINITY_DN105855_c0_g1~~TRINITY_DN105855_c0_g1_i1.p1  ORF type:complete len:783 (+),score=199.98 TRINITY_DN105855_c0_g1_i1:28-2376(+)